jgi:tetratricopeptide (TPR) repeat protein
MDVPAKENDSPAGLIGPLSSDFVTRINSLNEQAWGIRRSKTKESLELSRQSLDLARANSYQRGIAYSRLNIGYCYFLTGDHKAALAEGRAALSLFERLGDEGGAAKVLNYFGRLHQEEGDSSAAFENFSECLRIFEEAGDQYEVCNTFNNIGMVYFYLGDYTKALGYYQQCLRIAEDNGYRDLVGHPLCNISGIYDMIGEHEKAIEYMGKSVQCFREIGDVTGEALSLTNLGEFHRKAGDIPTALACHTEALEASRKCLNKNNEATAFLNLGKVYHSAGEHEKALDSYAGCLRVSGGSGHKIIESDCLIALGELYRERGEYDRAVEALSRALDTARRASLGEYIYEAHLALSRAHELRGDTALALAHHKEFFEFRRRVFSEEADKNLNRVMAQAEIEKARKEAEIHHLRHVELAAHVRELEEALAQIKQLQSLLPICSYCKSIRDDEDYWQGVESYMSRHAGVQFSHSVCPECYKNIERLAAATNAYEPLKRLFVSERGRVVPLRVADITRLEAQDDYVSVHAGGASYLAHLTLNEFAAKLDAARFRRVHRSHVVNVEHVLSIEPFDRRLLLRMRDGSEVLSSRAGAQQLRDLIV